MGSLSRRLLPILGALVLLTLCLPAQRGGLDLSGQVKDPAGKPIPYAEVFAQPNKIRTCGGQGFCLYGYEDQEFGWQCPVCVGDLGERTRADAEGRFVIPGLSFKFAHYVVAAAPGFNSDWVGPIYPEKGSIAIELDPRSPERKLYRGRVLDPMGEPLAAASVLVVARSSNRDRTWSRKGLDRLVSSDEDGRFVISCEPEFDQLHLRIRAEGHAVLMTELYSRAASRGTQVFRMPHGSVLSGRILSGADPLADVELRLLPTDRYPTRFHGPIGTRSDEQGQFAFANARPGTKYRLFAVTESMLGRGALEYFELRMPLYGKNVDLEELFVKPGYRLRGRVVSSDGSELPSGIRILITRPETWDFVPVDVEDGGSFEVVDLPRETLSLAFTVPGYHLSDENPNRDLRETSRLLGRMEADLDEFVVVLAPGEVSETAQATVPIVPVQLTSAR